jgi:hypothetical protein
LPYVAGDGVLETLIMKLIRFWFEFDNIHSYGVTAWNYDDAINILKEKVFSNTPFPVIKHVIENVDV